jgi:hypothetical protein
VLCLRTEVNTAFIILDRNINTFNASFQNHSAIAAAQAGNLSPFRNLEKVVASRLVFSVEFFGFLWKELSSTPTIAGNDLQAGPLATTAVAASADANQPLAILSVAAATVASLVVLMGLAMVSCHAFFVQFRANSTQWPHV